MRILIAFILALAFASAAAAQEADEPIRDVLMHLGELVSAGDADKASALWADDAILIDQAGEEIAGKTAIQARLKEVSATGLVIHPDKIDHPAADVAFVIGSTSRGTGVEMVPVGKFSAMLVHKNAQWLIARATDTPVQIRAEERLQPLAWMVGAWDAGNGNRIEMRWAPGKSFLIATLQGNGKDSNTHIIGWDPGANCITSWHFDLDGSFGKSFWTRQDSRWLVDFQGVAANGDHTHAISTLTAVNNDEFTWHPALKATGPFVVKDAVTTTWKRDRK